MPDNDTVVIIEFLNLENKAFLGLLLPPDKPFPDIFQILRGGRVYIDVSSSKGGSNLSNAFLFGKPLVYTYVLNFINTTYITFKLFLLRGAAYIDYQLDIRQKCRYRDSNEGFGVSSHG